MQLRKRPWRPVFSNTFLDVFDLLAPVLHHVLGLGELLGVTQGRVEPFTHINDRADILVRGIEDGALVRYPEVNRAAQSLRLTPEPLWRLIIKLLVASGAGIEPDHPFVLGKVPEDGGTARTICGDHGCIGR